MSCLAQKSTSSSGGMFAPRCSTFQLSSAADVLAKPLFGLLVLVLAIALAKSRDEGYREAGDTRPDHDTNVSLSREAAVS